MQHTPPAPWLDQWLCPVVGSPLAKLSTDIRQKITEVESRTRARKADDAARFEIMVDVLTANLAKVVLSGPVSLLVLTANNAVGSHSRYDNPAIGKPQRPKTLAPNAPVLREQTSAA